MYCVRMLTAALTLVTTWITRADVIGVKIIGIMKFSTFIFAVNL